MEQLDPLQLQLKKFISWIVLFFDMLEDSIIENYIIVIVWCVVVLAIGNNEVNTDSCVGYIIVLVIWLIGIFFVINIAWDSWEAVYIFAV